MHLKPLLPRKVTSFGAPEVPPEVRTAFPPIPLSLPRSVAPTPNPYGKRRAICAPERRRPSTSRFRFVTMVAEIAGARFRRRFHQPGGGRRALGLSAPDLTTEATYRSFVEGRLIVM